MATDNNITRLIAWWIDQLSGVFTKRPSNRAWRTLLLHTSKGLVVFKRTGRSTKILGTLNQDGEAVQLSKLKKKIKHQTSQHSRQVLLRLSQDDVLQRTIQIPQAASDVIVPVLRHQMERTVPWPEDQTHFGYKVLGRNTSNPDELNVCVVATKRSVLDAALAEARQLGLTPYSVDFAQDPEDSAGVEIISMGPDPRVKMATRIGWTLGSLVIATIAISCFGLFQIFYRQAESDELAHQIGTTKAKISSISTQRAENAKLWQQGQRLIQRKGQEPAAVVLVEALSRALPNDAYLTELEIQGREIRLIGKSSDAAALVPLLEDTSHLEEVQFSAPTTRAEGGNLAKFSISARAYGKNQLDY